MSNPFQQQLQHQQWKNDGQTLVNWANQSATVVAKGASQYPGVTGADLTRVMSLDRATAMNDRTALERHHWYQPK